MMADRGMIAALLVVLAAFGISCGTAGARKTLMRSLQMSHLRAGGAPQRAAQDECDRLAAHPTDPRAHARGVELAKIEVEAAIVACTAALHDNPDGIRFIYQLGRANDAGRRYERARELYTTAGELGYPMAMIGLSLLVERGQGGPHDLAAASAWAERATTTGLPLAFSRLSFFYRYGLGVPYDPVRAFELATRAAELDWPAGMRQMAEALKDGAGVAKDKWSRRDGIGLLSKWNAVALSKGSPTQCWQSAGPTSRAQAWSATTLRQ